MNVWWKAFQTTMAQDMIKHGGLEEIFRSVALTYFHKQQRLQQLPANLRL